MVHIREMTTNEYTNWMELSLIQQAKDRAKVNHSSFEDEHKQLRQILPILLPDFQNTSHHHFFTIDVEPIKNVGFIWFSPIRQIDPTTTFLTDIMIDPKYRSQGIGRSALDLAQNKIKSLGYSNIELYVLHDNYAKNLYQSMGYQVIEQSLTASLMQLHL